FHRFGFDEVFPISAEHGNGIGEMLDALVSSASWKLAPPEDSRKGAKSQSEAETAGTLSALPAPRELNLAIVGRPNVGKSSLLNRLLGEDRAIVSPLAGTTRDTVDTLLKTEEQTYRIIDT